MKKNDFILLGILIFFIMILLFFVNIYWSHKGEVVEVLVNGEIQAQFSLYEDIDYKIETESGYNLLRIEDGEAYILEASCPDQLCVHQKKISEDGESLICLPNKVVVRISGQDKTIDAMVN